MRQANHRTALTGRDERLVRMLGRSAETRKSAAVAGVPGTAFSAVLPGAGHRVDPSD